jgi:hypothetical protein
MRRNMRSSSYDPQRKTYRPCGNAIIQHVVPAPETEAGDRSFLADPMILSPWLAPMPPAVGAHAFDTVKDLRPEEDPGLLEARRMGKSVLR